MSSIFAQRRQKLLALKALRGTPTASPHAVERCPSCQGEFTRRELVAGRYVCPLCGHHYPVGAYYRLSMVLDKGTFRELDEALASADPLEFPGYDSKLEQAQGRTGMNEAVVTAVGRMGGVKVAVGAMDSRFFMGSMSAALGEKVTRLVEYAGKNRLPLILFSASGGALALGVGNRVLMLDNAVYSVLSPEGFAAILWKDASRSGEACDVMKLTAADLLALGVVDEIIPEPEGGAHKDPNTLYQTLDAALVRELTALNKLSPAALAAGRYKKFRVMGSSAVRKERL